eukprot:2670303-Rhodomonas_salina.1
MCIRDRGREGGRESPAQTRVRAGPESEKDRSQRRTGVSFSASAPSVWTQRSLLSVSCTRVGRETVGNLHLRMRLEKDSNKSFRGGERNLGAGVTLGGSGAEEGDGGGGVLPVGLGRPLFEERRKHHHRVDLWCVSAR